MTAHTSQSAADNKPGGIGLEPEKDGKGDDGKHRREPVDDRCPPQLPADCCHEPECCDIDPIEQCPRRRRAAQPPDERVGYGNEQEIGQKNSNRGGDPPSRPAYEVADERGGTPG